MKQLLLIAAMFFVLGCSDDANKSIVAPPPISTEEHAKFNLTAPADDEQQLMLLIQQIEAIPGYAEYEVVQQFAREVIAETGQ